MPHGAETLDRKPQTDGLQQQAKQLAESLCRQGCRVVFAESCTGGLVSAALTAIPGISEFHCGSAVVYRIETKARWLGIDRELLERTGAVSELVSAKLAAAVLERSPEADLAAAVTGHLGPDAPPEQDGLLFVATLARSRCEPDRMGEPDVSMHRLRAPATTGSPEEIRRQRQIEAATLVVQDVRRVVEGFPSVLKGPATPDPNER